MAIVSSDITTLCGPIGLIRMSTLPQKGTNSITYLMNVMARRSKDCITSIPMPFLDDIAINRYLDDDKDEIRNRNNCRSLWWMTYLIAKGL